MNHPLIGFRNRLLFYAIVWLLVAGMHFILLQLEFNLAAPVATVDALTANAIFAILGLSCWYPVRYLPPETLSLPRLMLAHLSSALLLNLIWLGLLLLIYEQLAASFPGLSTLLTDSWIWRLCLGFLFYLAITSYYYTHIYYLHFQQKSQQETELKNLVTTTELKTLKFQINPHFIFNSLNSINALILTEPQRASEMTVSLASFLRTTLTGGDQPLKTLREELDSVNQYLAIEKIRFGRRLDYRSSVDEGCLAEMIPTMLLQPLFENAIKHGVYQSSGPVSINLKVAFEKNFLVIRLDNMVDPASQTEPDGTGTGLTNIRKRLELIYHFQNLLKTRQEKDRFYVTLFIPQSGAKIA